MAIIDNFGSDFINEATSEQDGLMSASDKIKLDNINLKDIEYIKAGIEELAQANSVQLDQ